MCTIITIDVFQEETYIRSNSSAAQRGVARIVDPLLSGKTAYRVNGEWTVTSYPDQEDLLQADLVLMGGHEHHVEDIDLISLTLAGIPYTNLGPCEGGGSPGAYHLYPSSQTFPSTVAYPE